MKVIALSSFGYFEEALSSDWPLSGAKAAT
jgi:hypothetical protein